MAHDGDHPRSRGEYEGREKSVIAGVGSSPLSRGIPRVPQIAAGRVRIIPALAGNTQGARCYLCSRGDHPRSRGEYAQAEVNSSFCPGSSPLSRGIPGVSAVRCQAPRIIPALAGNTMGMRVLHTAHEGSSPLSRGIHHPARRHPLGRRIIPALAGNTVNTRSASSADRDHPRSRGEYVLRPATHPHDAGSSPLSRGIRGGAWVQSVGMWDHPRSRGEYRRGATSCRRSRGSSPLSRGILTHAGEFRKRRGIIPALAGNTSPRTGTAYRPADHPRSRGEYRRPKRLELVGWGSSPLSRGIRGAGQYTKVVPRIIPALAGNTPP